jgi:hypothetical protein
MTEPTYPYHYHYNVAQHPARPRLDDAGAAIQPERARAAWRPGVDDSMTVAADGVIVYAVAADGVIVYDGGD